MQFLKTLFWVVVAVTLVLFAMANWFAVTLNLWGGLQADVKLPLLLLFAFLLGFVPTFLLYRARLWALRRRIDGAQAVANVPAANLPAAVAPEPPSEPRNEEDRIATDSKVWPA